MASVTIGVDTTKARQCGVKLDALQSSLLKPLDLLP